ncbi:putative cell adhesion protein [Brevibacillus phage SecTim467]|uniref:Putative cell adhesion protein n=2 Tax=Jenstvirus jenst TaxID=1982225 RepID=A0A0K2CPP1_9CAUD|nr:cell adhesion protein [Brevibacillus phage Jenst]ALA07175.1 putative cell adhesion protein [Brevibacillus phage Jenst]ALA07544.1 putative cell adhesion protein [Brevibacillus phage SecTim467]
MGIYKKWSGAIFDDRFDSGSIHSRYTLSPSDSVTLDSTLGQLVIPHNEGDTSVMFDVPEEPTLLMEVTADYVPTELMDEGGIIIWQDGYHRLEFLESKDTTVREYSRWRALKKGNKWTFFANRGSGWEVFDTAPMVAEKMGVILRNKHKDGFDTLNVDRIVVCKSDKFTVGNLPAGYTVYLCNPEGNTISTAVVEPNWTGCEIALPSVPYNGIIRVYDVDGNLLSSLGAFDIYGGDVFLFGTELEVHWNGKELNKEKETYLGTMYDGQILVQMVLENPSKEKPASTITLGILKYLEKFGYEWTDICQDDGNDRPTGDFSKLLDMGHLGPSGSKKFWMKVEKTGGHFQIEPLHFILDISHT